MSEAQVRADLHRLDDEETANDEKEISCGDGEGDDFHFDEVDDEHQHQHQHEDSQSRNRQAPKKMTQAAFIILGLQIEEAQ